MKKEYIEDLLTVGCCPGHVHSCEEVYKYVKHQQKVIDRLSRKIQKRNKELTKYKRLYGKSVKVHLQKDKKIEELQQRIDKAKTEISALMSRYFYEEDFYIEDTDLDKLLQILDEGEPNNE